MKIKYLILCFVASLLASCGEIDESNLKLYPSKLYLGVSGYNLQEIYDLGEESLVWDVYVDKSGYYDNAAEVELSYDPTVLTDYQELTQEGLDFEVLPEHVGTLGQKRLSLAADATLGGTQLTFDMTTLRTLIPKDEEVKYVYPVRIKSLTEGVEVNTDKDYLLLAIRLNTPQANLRGRGSLIEVSCDPWRNVNMDKVTVPLVIDLPFENKDMELTFTYQTSRDALRQMQSQVKPVFDAASLYVSGDGEDRQKLSQLYAFLMERFDYKIETSITPAYSLLRHGVGDSRAFATVYAAMCRLAGLECMTVTGTHAGDPWTWNIVLDEKGGPNHVSNLCDAPIMCNTNTKEVEYKLSYYYIEQFSHYVLPGAKRIAATCYTDKLETVSFVNPDGTLAVVLLNRTEQCMPVTLRVKGSLVACEIEASSMTTIVLN